jgi:sporulation protein YabP
MELDGRSRLSVTGVQDVESFDEETVVLVTVQGTMVVRGEGLHLQMLSLESGQVTVEGRVDSMTYEDDAPGGGFFARLFG